MTQKQSAATHIKINTYSRLLWTRSLFTVLLTALFVFSLNAQAVDTICAKVKIEIVQELTMERQGFDAMMKITNGLTTSSLDNVAINVNFLDEAGNSVRATSDPADTTAAFFIRIDTMSGISNVTGTGVVAPASVAEIHWLIIPAAGTGGVIPSGKLYYVGATLDYSIAGKPEQVVVSPDFIYVKPMPLLTLDYFMTKDVWGDDPLTLETELVEPYTLGVRIKNNGAATATNVKIDSAQPRITENKQGLLINFEIIGSFLNDKPAISSLLIPFGDILPNSAANGRWLMTSSLAGHFEDFNVTFVHADALGGAVTSLIQATNPHYLIRDVKVDMPGRDNVRDFLALDGDVLRVYESSGLDTLVTDQSAASVLTPSGTNSSGAAVFYLTTPVTAGPMYVQFVDPHSGSKAVGTMTRSDGKTIPPENVWLSKKRDDNQVMRYYFNLFDTNSTGIYNTNFSDVVAVPHPPVIQLVVDSTVTEGNQLTFTVTATDPDGTAPLLSASSLLPSGATFTTAVGANNVVTGTFNWKPAKGMAGKYPITFRATDGAFNVTTSTNVTVTTPIVPAGPDMPLIAAPQVGTETNLLSPRLEVATSVNALDTANSYHFQVYADEGMQTLVVEKLAQPRVVADKTVWILPLTLADNTQYYWRVRASDGTTFSSWAVGRFFVNTVNDAPTAPVIASPANGTTVAVTTPQLSVTNSTDAENDIVSYGFDVYSDSLLTQKVASVVNLPAGSPDLNNGGSTSWAVSPALNNTTLYYWRASATDSHGAKTVSATGNFLVDTSKPAPAAPALISPAASSVVTSHSIELTVANSVRASGMTLSYYFELDRTQNFASADIIRSGAVVEGGVNTAFSATGLVENAHYYWRVKSSDGLTDSPWTYGNFTVDTVNDAPTIPGAINPGNNAWVTTTQPLFTLAPATDPEGDAIGYRIEIYSDAALSSKVMDRLTNKLTWLVDVQLTDDVRYYWRVRAEDMRGGLSAWSPVSSFIVRTGSSGSSLPVVALTSPLKVVNVSTPSAVTPAVSVNISWEIDDSLGNSHVALYYDNDALNADGTRIIDGLPQDPSSRIGNYTWDVTALSPGTYYIYAVVSNSAGTVTRYAPGSFIVPVPAPRGIVTVTPLTVLETSEAGVQAQFSVVLGNSPKSNVSIGLSSTLPSEGLVTPSQLLFTTANWKTPQVINVIGQSDCLNDGDVSYQVIVAKSVSSDGDYNGIKGNDLTLLNRASTVGCLSNNPPVANAGPAQKVDGGTVVALNGSGIDTDGAIASYAWVQTAGPTVVLADAGKAMTSFTAPLRSLETLYTFKLTVTDNGGAVGTASVNITVKAAPNVAPTANAGTDQTVMSGSNVKLTGVGTDSDGTIVTYKWMQIAGDPSVVLTTSDAANSGFIAPMVTVNSVFGFSLTVTDNLGATATSTVLITLLPNQAPLANAGANQTVDESTTVTLAGSGTDADGSVVSYQWTQTGTPAVSLVNANTAVATFTAPAVMVDTVLTLNLAVTDNLGGISTASTTVMVKHVNLPPVVNAGANQSVKESSVVTLTGSATDSDGTIASYLWTQTAGEPVTINAPNAAIANFTAPATLVESMLTFKLTVTDNSGASSSATTNVSVSHNNLPPTANAGTSQMVNESTTVHLTGSGADTDGTVVSYLWTQTSGQNVVLMNANTGNPSFTAPATLTDIELVFALTVTDNKGATGAASTSVTVKHLNISPVANAGINQTVNENMVATLNGTATDSDGSIASYLWKQTGGDPVVVLSNANAAIASFITPLVSVNTPLTFTLTVTDNVGSTNSANTIVNVKNVNIVPTVSAGVNQTVNEGSPVTLSGTATDSDGSITKYLWTQTGGPAVTLSDTAAPVVSFVAPIVDTASANLTFRLTVTDNDGASRSDSTTVAVKMVNIAPVADAGTAQTVDELSNVTLSGSATDSDGNIATYLWTQTGGPTVTLSDTAAPTTSFVTPAAVTASTTLSFRLTVTDNRGSTSYATTKVTVKMVNAAPVVDAGVAQTVDELVNVMLSGSATDSDGTIATYLWAQTGGPTVTLSDTASPTTSFTAPAAVTASTTLSFRLTVTDNRGSTSYATTKVTVKMVNAVPVVDAGAAQTVDELANVTLSGSATDSDGTIATYLWTQTGGPTVTLSDTAASTVTFTAPAVVTASTTLSFRLTVTDNRGSTSYATTKVTVKMVNAVPVVDAGAAQTVDELSNVTLSGSATDSDGTIATYLWTQTGGPTVTLSDTAAPTVTFVAPAAVTASTTLSFRLTVTDNRGSTSYAITKVTVKMVNAAPVADAGMDQTVAELTTVTLTGAGTDSDGTIMSYQWTQTAGPAVTLSNPSAAITSFEAPEVTTSTTLRFRLTVTDNRGTKSSADTARVIVKN